MFKSKQTVTTPTEKSNPNHKERGASMVEYSLLVALIAVVAITGVTSIGSNAAQKFTAAAEAMGGGEIATDND